MNQCVNRDSPRTSSLGLTGRGRKSLAAQPSLSLSLSLPSRQFTKNESGTLFFYIAVRNERQNIKCSSEWSFDENSSDQTNKCRTRRERERNKMWEWTALFALSHSLSFFFSYSFFLPWQLHCSPISNNTRYVPLPYARKTPILCSPFPSLYGSREVHLPHQSRKFIKRERRCRHGFTHSATRSTATVS